VTLLCAYGRHRGRDGRPGRYPPCHG
jgi:hypothetical protein